MTVLTPTTGTVQSIAQSVARSKRLLAVAHTNPDGDAIGSLVAFSLLAKALGIEVRLYCDSPIPDFLDCVDYPSPPVMSLAELGGWQADTVVFLDCAEERLAGPEMAECIASCRGKAHECAGTTLVCIDHHMTNPLFADINWVDASMSATGVMVGLLAREFDQPLSGPLGEAVYLAIVSDTGYFRFSNTNALALELAAEIVRNGLSLVDFANKYENTWTLSRMNLWGTLMREVKILCAGKIVVSVVTEAHLREYGTGKADLDGYASWLRRLKGVKIVILARPRRSGSKVSLRSMGDVDVQEIAAQFGGGGHKGAAGVNMADPPFEAANIILQCVCRSMDEESG